MRLRLRRLQPGETDHELIWLSVSLAAAFAGAAWIALGLPFPRCTFRMLTGAACLTCGATRAALALASGNFAAAWALNPLATISLVGLAAFNVYAAAVLLVRGPRVRMVLPPGKLRLAVVSAACAAALSNWIYLLRQ